MGEAGRGARGENSDGAVSKANGWLIGLSNPDWRRAVSVEVCHVFLRFPFFLFQAFFILERGKAGC